MLRNIIIVAKREYIKVVRKPTFWLTTLFFPAFIVVASLISGLSGETLENSIENNEAIDNIVVVDESGLIKEEVLSNFKEYKFVDSLDQARELVRNNEVDIAIYYPENVLENRDIQAVEQTQGFLSGASTSFISQEILKQSILKELGNDEKITAVKENFNVDITSYNEEGEKQPGFERFIVPIVSVVIYFVLIMFSTGYLLMSVAEEKENRMIEIVMSTVRPRELIWGKILGQLGIVLTQVATLLSLAILSLVVAGTNFNLPIDFSEITITPEQIIGGVFYIVCGFLIMANLMVGVGAATPTYKEAQSFSSIFIILSILPIYFVPIILSAPSGTVSLIVSYFPLTSALILLFRNALGEIALWESIFSGTLLIFYVVVSFYLSFKMFEFGALEYSKKISFKNLLKNLKQ